MLRMKIKALRSPVLLVHWPKIRLPTITVTDTKLTTILSPASPLRLTEKGTTQTLTYSGKAVALQKVFL